MLLLQKNAVVREEVEKMRLLAATSAAEVNQLASQAESLKEEVARKTVGNIIDIANPHLHVIGYESATSALHSMCLVVPYTEVYLLW